MPLSDEDLAKELFRSQLVTVDVIQQAVQRRTPQKNLAKVLIESGIVSEDAIRGIDPTFDAAPTPAAPAKQAAPPAASQADLFDLSQGHIDMAAVALLPRDRAASLKALPLSRDGNRLKVAMANPRDLPAIDELTRLTGCRLEVVAVNPDQLMQAINRLYSSASLSEMQDMLPSAAAGTMVTVQDDDLGGLVQEAPAIKVANMILQEAVQQGASDIHIEPREGTLCLRYRIDGVLRGPTPLEKSWEQAIISRFKVLAEFDLAESRMPQDGRFRQIVSGKVIDFRVSSLPTFHGEKIVLRLLDKSSLVSMDKLGFLPDMKQKFEEMVLKPQGMILVTGPTGSGKSTTLYAALNHCKTETKNIVTVEDPVEYQLEGINQTQVIPKINLDFATQLRAILRQDPDVILVGEIRDKETADMAFRAALTGHLVLATLHTNDAPSTVTRLLDMGMEPYLIASSIIAVLAQRLVRVICPKCKEPTVPDEFDLARLSIPREEGKGMKFFKGRGCGNCNNSGYKGRLGVYELLVMSESVRKKVADLASASDVRMAAIQSGMRAMKQDGLLKVQQGLTTLDELARVLFTSIEDEMLEEEHSAAPLNLAIEEPTKTEEP